MDDVSATARLVELGIRRGEAVHRIDSLEQAWRDANQQLTQARDHLIELERKGGTQADRAKAEKQLAAAEATAAERWPERVEGARRAARDVDAERVQFIAENLDALVADLEADGREAAQRLNDHAQAVVDAHIEVNRIAGEIGALASTVGRVNPGDVTRSRGDQLARAANELLLGGGESPPVLRRQMAEVTA